MIVVDASALVAIAESEPEAPAFLEILERCETAIISPTNAVEAGVVLMGRGRFADAREFDRWLAALGVEVDTTPINPIDVLSAYARFGRGRHPARLNLGDTFAYALAKTLDAPLLFKGDDFTRTDIRPALQPT